MDFSNLYYNCEVGKNAGGGKLEVADIFSKYVSSVVAIGWAYFKKAEDINVPREMLLEGRYRGKAVNVLPCASSFVLSIDENRTLLATANHAFPNPAIDKATICLIVMPQKCPYEVNMEDIAAYPGLLRYTRFAEQDLCLFEVETPEALYLQSPSPFTLSFDFKVGDEVCSMGYPFIGFEGYSQGQRDIRFIERLTCAHLCSVWSDVKKRTLILEFDNYIGPGNSGGPLISVRNGAAIGVVTATRKEDISMTTFSQASCIIEFDDVRHDFPSIPPIELKPSY